MKLSVITATCTGLLAVGAGVAIAGFPDDGDEPGHITFVAPTTVAVATSTSVLPVVDTEVTMPGTTTPDTTTPDTTTPDTTVPEATTPDTTTAPETTAPDEPAMVPRGDLVVVTANGSGQGGVAGSTRDELRSIGYADVTALDSEPTERSTVYHLDGLEEEATRLLDDLGWESDRVAPLDDVPALSADVTAQLVVVIGSDRP